MLLGLILPKFSASSAVKGITEIYTMKRHQTTMSVQRVFFIFGLFALLSACTPVSDTLTQGNINTDGISDGNALNNKSDSSKNITLKAAEVAFPEEVLYQLLVADIALIRGQFEFALEKYRQQARQTRDTGVIEMANRVAGYQGNSDALLETALLWIEVAPEQRMAHRAALHAYAMQRDPLSALPHAYWLFAQQDDIEAFLAVTAIAESSDREVIAPLITAYQNLALAADKLPMVKLAQAILYRENGEFATAIKTAEQFLELAPDNQRGLLFLAQTLQQQDRVTEALGILEEALQRMPNNQSLRLQYAQLLTLTDRAQAIVQFEMLRLNNADNQQVNFLLGLLYLNQGSTATAKDLFQLATSDPSLYADAHYHLGTIADRQDNATDALQHYRRVDSGRNYLASVSRTAQLLSALDSLQTARSYLQQLRIEQPGHSPALFQIESNLLLGSDQPDQAFNVLSAGLQAHPNNSQLLYARSMVAELQDNFTLVEEDLRRLLAQDADNPAALNALGYTMLLHTERHTEAHKLIKRAYLLNPGDPAILDSLGWVLFVLGEAQQALTYLEKAMAILVDPEIAAHLGEVQWFLGDRQAAVATWQRGLEQNPEHKILTETIERHGKHSGEQLDTGAFSIESRSTIKEKPSGE